MLMIVWWDLKAPVSEEPSEMQFRADKKLQAWRLLNDLAAVKVQDVLNGSRSERKSSLTAVGSERNNPAVKQTSTFIDACTKP